MESRGSPREENSEPAKDDPFWSVRWLVDWTRKTLSQRRRSQVELSSSHHPAHTPTNSISIALPLYLPSVPR